MHVGRDRHARRAGFLLAVDPRGADPHLSASRDRIREDDLVRAPGRRALEIPLGRIGRIIRAHVGIHPGRHRAGGLAALARRGAVVDVNRDGSRHDRNQIHPRANGWNRHGRRRIANRQSQLDLLRIGDGRGGVDDLRQVGRHRPQRFFRCILRRDRRLGAAGRCDGGTIRLLIRQVQRPVRGCLRGNQPESGWGRHDVHREIRRAGGNLRIGPVEKAAIHRSPFVTRVETARAQKSPRRVFASADMVTTQNRNRLPSRHARKIGEPSSDLRKFQKQV